MTLLLDEPADPMTPFRRSDESRVDMPDSTASEPLRFALERYADGKTRGRSFLVVGHRGAGKTTSVLREIENTRFLWKSKPFRPLLVKVNGPSMLLPAFIEQGAGKAQTSPASPDDPQAQMTHHVLKLFALNLYRALCGEFVDSFRQRVEQLRGLQETLAERQQEASSLAEKVPFYVYWSPWRNSALRQYRTRLEFSLQEQQRHLADNLSANFASSSHVKKLNTKIAENETRIRDTSHLISLLGEITRIQKQLRPWPDEDLEQRIGQLVMDLDDAPDPALLTDYLQVINRIDEGVLFDKRYEDRRGQGALEVVALSSASQVFRVVSGKVTDTKTTDRIDSFDETPQESVKPGETKLSISDGLQNTLATAVGALVGIVPASQVIESAGPDSGFFGPLVVLGLSLTGALGLRYISKRTTSRKITRQHVYIRDFTLTTLERDIPKLIDRVTQAGLMPVLMIDELDKVDGLRDKLKGLIRQTKHILVEQLLAIFLANRDFYEELKRLERDEDYPEEQTYFSQHLYTHFKPLPLFTYVSDLPGQAHSLSLRQAYALYLLFDARMHIFDLNRLFVSRDVDLKHVLNSQRHKVIYQLAFTVIVQGLLDADLLNDAYHLQLVYDALYAPADLWMNGEPVISLSRDELQRKVFGDGESNKSKYGLSGADFDELIYDPYKKLLRLLSGNESPSTTFDTDSFRNVNLDNSIRRLLNEPLLRMDNESYIWRVNKFGTDPTVRKLDEVRNDALTAAQRAEEIWSAFTQKDIPVTLDQLVKYGVLSNDPTMEAVEDAKKLLDATTTPPERTSGSYDSFIRACSLLTRHAAQFDDRQALLDVVAELWKVTTDKGIFERALQYVDLHDTAEVPFKVTRLRDFIAQTGPES